MTKDRPEDFVIYLNGKGNKNVSHFAMFLDYHYILYLDYFPNKNWFLSVSDLKTLLHFS